MSAKISKLQNQFSDAAKETGANDCIFKGVAIFVNGYTGLYFLIFKYHS